MLINPTPTHPTHPPTYHKNNNPTNNPHPTHPPTTKTDKHKQRKYPHKQHGQQNPLLRRPKKFPAKTPLAEPSKKSSQKNPLLRRVKKFPQIFKL